MKIKVICQQCFHKGYLSESNLFEKIILQESTLYHFRCKHQHDNLVLLQAFKFEILFESGLCAINDKYYLEAVLSLTASLERFYEFAIKILSTGNGLSFDDFEKLYKQISNQSERQLGAFLFLYSYVYKQLPELLDNRYVKFRNQVVHKGYLPSEEEVIDYAKEIYKNIKYYYIQLRQNYKGPFLSKVKKTSVVLDSFGDSAVNLGVWVWVPVMTKSSSLSSVREHIYNAFNEHGISIPFPQQDLYVKEFPGGAPVQGT